MTSREGFTRGALMIMAGTGAAQVIVVLSTPFITRLYQPSEYGLYATALAILAILTPIACLRFDIAIAMPEKDEEAANVFALSLLTAVFMSLGTLVLLLPFGPLVFEFFGAPSLGRYAFLIAVGTLAAGVTASLVGWMLRTRRYADLSRNRVVESSSMVIVQAGLGLLGAGALGLLVGAIAGIIAGAQRLARVAWASGASAFRQVTRRGIRRAADRYRRFPLLSTPSALLNAVSLQAPLLLVVALYGTTVGGEFALAQRVIVLPTALIATAVGQTFYAEGARIAREDPIQLRPFFVSTVRMMALVAIIPITLAAILSPLLFGVVFGEAWEQAGIYAALLAPMYYVQFITNPTGRMLDVLERQDLTLTREFVRLGLICLAITVAAGLSLSPTEAIAVLSITGTIAYGVYGFLAFRAVRTYHDRAMAATPPGRIEPEGSHEGMPGEDDGSHVR